MRDSISLQNSVRVLNLYRDFKKPIINHIIKKGGNRMEAEDAFQSAISAIFIKMKNEDQIGDDGAYLFRCAWNGFLKEKRHQKKIILAECPYSFEYSKLNLALFPNTSIAVSQDVTDGLTNTLEESDVSISLKKIQKAISTLGKTQQEIILNSFEKVHHKSDEEIAEKLHISKKYVRLARFRALQILRLEINK